MIKSSGSLKAKKQMDLNSFLPHHWRFLSHNKGEVVELLVLVFSKGDHGGAGLGLVPCSCHRHLLKNLSCWWLVSGDFRFQRSSGRGQITSGGEQIGLIAFCRQGELSGCLIHSAKTRESSGWTFPVLTWKSSSRSVWSRPSETRRASYFQ